MKKLLLLSVIVICNCISSYSQSLGGYSIIDYLVSAVHPYGCSPVYILGPPNDSTWVNFNDGDIMTGSFGSSWSDGPGDDLLLETSYHEDNYNVRLQLFGGGYSNTYNVTTGIWTQITDTPWVHLFTSCSDGMYDVERYIVPLDFGTHFGLTPTDVVTGIEITFLTTTGAPDLAGVYIISGQTVQCSVDLGNDTTLCPGDSLILDATTTGASYTWQDNSTNPQFVVTQQGVYWVEIDVNGCIASDTIVVNYNAPPVVDLGVDTSFCTGGNVVLDADNGFTSYLWNTNDITQNIQVSLSGTYSVTVTDAIGCTGVDQINVSENSNPIPAISGLLSFCSGSSTTLDAGSGYSEIIWDTGDSTQTIQVSLGGTYIVTVTDVNGCTGTDQVNVTENPFTIPSISGILSFCSGSSTSLDAGAGYISYLWNTGDITQTVQVSTGNTYSVTVTDATGCSGSDQVVVTENVNPTPVITGALSFCNGSSTSLDAGSGYISYLWNTGAITQSIQVTSIGTYTVSVTDVNGCTGNTQVVVTENSNPTPAITGVLSFCSGSSTSLDVGSGYMSYLWNTGAITQSIQVTSGGTYTVSVTDINGCTGNTQVVVTENVFISPSISGILTFCTGLSTSLDAGSGYTSYLWSTGETTQSIQVSTEGAYMVTVTDANLCSGTDQVIVTEEPIILSVSQNQTICYGSEISLTVSVTNGAAPYQYYWSTGETSQIINVSPLTQTTYYVSVVDAAGCESGLENVTVSIIDPVEVEVVANRTEICPGENALITLQINNGVPPYYIYDEYGDIVSIPISVYPQETNEYIYYVEDMCGTIVSDSIEISTHAIPLVDFSTDTVAGCEPLKVEFNSLYPAADFLWNFGDNNNISLSDHPVHTYEHAGNYSVSLTVTSESGCTNSIIRNNLINVYAKPVAKFYADPEIASIIKPIINFKNLSSGHINSFWYFGDNAESSIENPSHTYPVYPTGTYNVILIVESARGCLDTTYNDIVIKNEYTFYAPTAFSPDFDGVNDEFKIFGYGIDKRNFNLFVYDRWGELIFKSQDLNDSWDGRVKGGEIAKNGSYTWICNFMDMDGIQHEESGSVTIIR